jgi:cysteine dioxygenase
MKAERDMATSNTATIVSIHELVSGLRQFSASSFEGTAEILGFLKKHQVRAETLQPYLCWDKQHYTRNLIDKTDLYEFIAICWEVGQNSSIHNHAQQNCWMSAPVGRLLVQNYRTLSEDVEAGICDIRASDVIEMNPGNPVAVNPLEPVHKVFNPPEFGERAVSLHVYSRPYDQCVVYSEEKHTCGKIKLSYTTQFGKASERASNNH